MKRSIAVMFAALMVASLASGCLGDDDDEYRNLGVLGDDKYELLRDDPYPNLMIELHYVKDYGMSSRAKNTFVDRIEQVTDKQDITWKTVTVPGGKARYSLEDVINIEREHRTVYKGGKNSALHILYLDGEYEDDENVLGMAYTASSFVMFKGRIDNAGGGTVSSEDIETSVLIHEFGHNLGLINIGYETPNPDHHDENHHSTNEPGLFNDGSVMIPGINSLHYWNQLNGNPPDEFDDDDLEDLRLLRIGEL